MTYTRTSQYDTHTSIGIIYVSSIISVYVSCMYRVEVVCIVQKFCNKYNFDRSFWFCSQRLLLYSSYYMVIMIPQFQVQDLQELEDLFLGSYQLVMTYTHASQYVMHTYINRIIYVMISSIISVYVSCMYSVEFCNKYISIDNFGFQHLLLYSFYYMVIMIPQFQIQDLQELEDLFLGSYQLVDIGFARRFL
eukprot:TRINITY_DN2099_c0_g1_i8.p1 TRINITY_DN2099_c0_g1~~TRINITY_DN2099_c0_g1_i8.p1  ORF type:complete len:192 (+),score=-25.13 TRINITY_DN2099_c0_g1_i8:138-713(+)